MPVHAGAQLKLGAAASVGAQYFGCRVRARNAMATVRETGGLAGNALCFGERRLLYEAAGFVGS
jgi:hypothetical protein